MPAWPEAPMIQTLRLTMSPWFADCRGEQQAKEDPQAAQVDQDVRGVCNLLLGCGAVRGRSSCCKGCDRIWLVGREASMHPRVCHGRSCQTLPGRRVGGQHHESKGPADMPLGSHLAGCYLKEFAAPAGEHIVPSHAASFSSLPQHEASGSTSVFCSNAAWQ